MSAMLLLATHGQGRRWYRYNGRSVELRTAPGMIELYGRQFQRESARWDGLPVSGWFFGSVTLPLDFVSHNRDHELACPG